MLSLIYFLKCVFSYALALNAGQSERADGFMDYFNIAEEEKNKD